MFPLAQTHVGDDLAVDLLLAAFLRGVRHLDEFAQVLQQLVAQLLVEGVGEELDEVGQLLDHVQVQLLVVAQLEQQRSH